MVYEEKFSTIFADEEEVDKEGSEDEEDDDDIDEQNFKDEFDEE